MVFIDMWSEKKGSNPGGKGTVLYNKGESLDIYIKYCTHSRLHASHPFKASNQPIYEAVTLGLAKKIGLEVPKYFLLVNEDKTLKFNYKTPEAKRLPIDEKREYYLLSELVNLPLKEDAERLKMRMRSEKIYRDLLMIADVSNKKQNFALLNRDGMEYVFYIDLGCSFIDAVNGEISQRNAIRRLIHDNSHGQIKDLRKELHHADNYLSKYNIITDHKEEQNKQIISLWGLVQNIPYLNIPIFPKGNKQVLELLSKDETELIVALLKLNMVEVIRKHTKENKSLDLLIKEEN